MLASTIGSVAWSEHIRRALRPCRLSAPCNPACDGLAKYDAAGVLVVSPVCRAVCSICSRRCERAIVDGGQRLPEMLDSNGNKSKRAGQRRLGEVSWFAIAGASEHARCGWMPGWSERHRAGLSRSALRAAQSGSGLSQQREQRLITCSA
jgi:hypothetical protein